MITKLRPAVVHRMVSISGSAQNVLCNQPQVHRYIYIPVDPMVQSQEFRGATASIFHGAGDAGLLALHTHFV